MLLTSKYKICFNGEIFFAPVVFMGLCHVMLTILPWIRGEEVSLKEGLFFSLMHHILCGGQTVRERHFLRLAIRGSSISS